MKAVTVVGARPQFIKAAAVSRVVMTRGMTQLHEVLVHTGQHYDKMMSNVFFDELGIAPPAYNLGISGGTHGAMTGRMLEAIERVLLEERPDWVLIYGDTNSTLAASLAASKLHIPVAHVEAGLRSFNMRMPEEINRIVADRLASLLFCPTTTAVKNLECEGNVRGVHLVGDVMYDVALHFAAMAAEREVVLDQIGVVPKRYILATCHRAENTDSPERLRGIAKALGVLAQSRAVVFPVHPRTRGKIDEYGCEPLLAGVTIIDPVSYLDMVALERNAEIIVTDSGGVQKEAFFYRVPCVTARDETEWVETVTTGWNALAGCEPDAIVHAVERHAIGERKDARPYGDGDAAERIVDLLLSAS